MTPPPHSTDALLVHAGALRRLAREILVDDEAAEDVVQETWLVALAGGPRASERLGGWLRAVARSLALKRLRSESRRARREHAAARDEQLGSTADSLERAAALRAVVCAVTELPEPFREVVLLRYFEELPPRAIAARTRVPVTTVHSRLRRAHARLRERLDREHGGAREAWSLGLAGALGLGRRGGALAPAKSAALVTSILGGTLMTLNTKVLAATLAVALLGGWLALREGPLATPAEPDGAAAAVAPRPDAALRATTGESAPAIADTEPAAREALAATPEPQAPPSAAADLGAPYTMRVTGVVVDGRDLPLANATVYAAPVLHCMNEAVKTGPDGSFELAWRAHVPRMRVALTVAGHGGWHGLREVEVTSGIPARVRVQAFATSLVGRLQLLVVADGRVMSHSQHGAPPFEPRLTSPYNFRHTGEATIEERLATTTTQLSLLHRLTLVSAVGDFQVSLDQPAPPSDPGSAALEGTLYALPDVPAGSAHVTALRDGVEVGATAADPEGRFRLDNLAPGPVTLRAGGGDFGVATMQADLLAGQTLRWDLLLDRGVELTGRLLDAEGKPLPAWLVEIEGASDAPWADGTHTIADGSFAIPNCPPGPMRVLVRRPNDWNALPVHVVDGVRAGAPIEITLDAASLAVGSVRALVTDEEGTPLGGAQVRLWHEEAQRGLRLAEGDEAGQHGAQDVPAGRYRIEYGHEGHGFLDGGEIVVRAGENDAGELRFRPRGTLAIVVVDRGLAGGDLVVRVLERRGDVDTLVDALARPDLFVRAFLESALSGVVNVHSTLVDAGPTRRSLPPGDYRVLVSGGTLGLLAVDCRVDSHQRTQVVVPLAATREATLVFPARTGGQFQPEIAVRVLDPNADVELFSTSFARSAQTDAHVVVRLLPGPYRVVVSDETGTLAERDLVVDGTGADPRVRIELP